MREVVESSQLGISQSAAKRIVLFGEAATALAAAACLRNYPITVVSAAAEHRLASLSRFVQDRIRLPERSNAQVFGRLESLRRRAGELLLLFPCTDAWIDTLAEDVPRTLELGKMLPASPAHLALTLDKAAFEREIGRLDLPRPVTLCVPVDSAWKPPDYPFVLKPSSTYRFEATRGVKALVIRSRKEWQSFDKRLLARDTFLAQEYLKGASISVCFCTTPGGQLAGSYATEKVHYSSMRTGSLVSTITRPDAIELASHFVRRTGFVGFGELEMIDSERGLLLLELNARPWSQILMSTSLGVPILQMAVELMSEQKLAESAEGVTIPCEWIAWDKDLLFRRALRRAGRPIRPTLALRRVYAQSFWRDPIPALVHAMTISRLGPGRFLGLE